MATRLAGGEDESQSDPLRVPRPIPNEEIIPDSGAG
jgi:hypothetical protein